MNNMTLFTDISSQRKSKVWQHFTYYKAEEKAKCSVCSAIIKASGSSTKSRITHLKSKHQIHIESFLEKSVSKPSFKKRKIDSYFKKDRRESLGEVVAKLVVVDGLAFNQIASSKLLRRTFAADDYSLPSSRDYVKKLFMKQFAEIQSKIVSKIREIKETSNRLSISFDKSTFTRNRRFVKLNLHFPVGHQSLGLFRVKGSMLTERAIELVQERLYEYALSLYDDIVSTIRNGTSIVIKFGRETKPLRFSCLAYAIHLSACAVLYTEKPKLIRK